MKPGRVVVQLIPYGWDLNPGKIRGYRQLTANMECTHLVWVNRKHDNAYFDRYFFTWDFHQKEPPFAYREHPDPADVAAGKQINEAGGLHPQYLYQVGVNVYAHTACFCTADASLQDLSVIARGCQIYLAANLTSWNASWCAVMLSPLNNHDHLQDTHVDIPSFLPVIDEAMRIMQQPEPAS